MEVFGRFRRLPTLLAVLPTPLILGMGIAMCVFAGLGSDVLTSFQQGLGLHIGLQAGTVNLIMNIIILLAFLFSDRSVVGVGSILTCVLTGPCMNLFENLFRALIPAPSLGVRLLFTLVGCLVLALILAWYIQLDMGVQPMDMILLTMARLMKRTYGTATYIFNAFMLVGTLLLGGAVGIGTIINLLCMGKLIDFLMLKFQPLIRQLKEGMEPCSPTS